MEALRIVALSVLAAVTYGVLHDQVTARMCLEYFTVAHPDVVGHEPTIIGLYWGVVATWWVGLPLGLGLAVASRTGARPKATWRDAVPRIAAMLGVLYLLAMASGAWGYLDGDLSMDAPHFLARVPAEHHAGFLFDVYAHSASYLGGALGGVVLWVVTFRARGAVAKAAS